MPHSPYSQEVQPPIEDLKAYETELRGYRYQEDEDIRDKYAASELLDRAETLLNHCHFLEEKLRIKVSLTKRRITSLEIEVKEISSQRNDLEDRLQLQKTEMETLRARPNVVNPGLQTPSRGHNMQVFTRFGLLPDTDTL
ncbi:hypothetical protein LTR70_007664 [Exophiala xenobiotica]|uniref:Uncharacterized protein n=1 Tax=Lithohypha guttulata TaxID=1690604 RepID=A0ABR0K3E0_9EURO|nr:hypothetical protein LTR24_007933 [Lithohypha guttulata]KAK5313360.1 hypothetical protein LTR70_007664 [Exophiala xenobiotica]